MFEIDPATLAVVDAFRHGLFTQYRGFDPTRRQFSRISAGSCWSTHA